MSKINKIIILIGILLILLQTLLTGSGNIIDFIPAVNNVAPWLAERSGLVSGSPVQDLNENLYQTTGALSGFYGGLFLPWKVLIDVASRSQF